ncbi:MAG: hypothetical protein Fur002_15910 [Anaerolineales bacterium]
MFHCPDLAAAGGESSARFPNLTVPLAALALVAESKRKKGEGLTEAQRRHRSKVEKRWKEERLARLTALKNVKTKWTGVNPETADMTEAEKLAAYKNTSEYKARQERDAAWREEKARKEEELKAGLMAYYKGRKVGDCCCNEYANGYENASANANRKSFKRPDSHLPSSILTTRTRPL